MVLWLLSPPQRTPVPCVTTTRPASKSALPRLRVRPRARLSSTAETLHRRIVMPTRPAAVDVVYSVWSDAGYGCEERILRDVQTRYNFYCVYRPAPVRPRAEYEFPRQQSMGRYQEGARCGAGHARRRRIWARAQGAHGPELFEDVDLKEYQRRFAAEPAVQRANGHFLMVSACLQGADIFMLGTPALILQHFSGSKSHSSEGGNLENKISRAWRRTDRMGPGEQAGRAVLPGRRECKPLMGRLYNGSTFRCAPLFAENIGRSR